MELGSPPCKEISKSSSRGFVIGHDDNDGKFDSGDRNTFDGNNINDLEEGIEGLKLNETDPRQKGLCKSNTFPSPGTGLPSAGSDEDGVGESVHSPCRSMSLPTPLNLVSAMKGSREKQGAAPMKLTVKWAPDVYDPPPTIVSHTVNRSKKQQPKLKKDGKNSKQKNGKKWQKGNSSSSRGGSSGSKNKQFRKNAGGYSHDREVLELSHDLHDLHDLDVGSPDSYCGSSFLKESLATMHYSVAEAL